MISDGPPFDKSIGLARSTVDLCIRVLCWDSPILEKLLKKLAESSIVNIKKKRERLKSLAASFFLQAFGGTQPSSGVT